MSEEQSRQSTWWQDIIAEELTAYWQRSLFDNNSLNMTANQMLREANPLLLAMENDHPNSSDAWVEHMVLRRFSNSRETSLGKVQENLVRRFAEHTFGVAWKSTARGIDVEFPDEKGERQLVSVKSSTEWASSTARTGHATNVKEIRSRLDGAPGRIVFAICNGTPEVWRNESYWVYRGDALWEWVTGGEKNVSLHLVKLMSETASNYRRLQQRVLRRAIAQFKHDIDTPEMREKYPWISIFSDGSDFPPLSPAPSVALEVDVA
jgi:hypothetical protein